MKIQKLSSNQYDQAIELLSGNQLPTEDLHAGHIELFGYWENDNLMGCIGIERFENLGLLRSLVVDSRLRGKGMGAQLVNYLEEMCIKNGVTDLFLLTETAEVFFANRDYLRIDRSKTPQPLLASAEFSHLCPDSAVLMVKKL